MHLGILGGTFDPPHNGHLFAARAAAERHRLDRVILVPARAQPLKASWAVTAPEIRLRMVEALAKVRPGLEVSRSEMDRPGPSYTFDTIERFKKLYPEAEFFFIVGADSVQDLSGWYRAKELVRAVRFVVVGRPGWPLGGIDRLAGTLGEEAANQIRADAVCVEGVKVSATEIRSRVRQGLPIGDLVPIEVEKIIREKSLYTD